MASISNCSCQILIQLIESILIVLLSIPLIPIYLVIIILPTIALLSICRLTCCKDSLPTVFEFYIRFVFWPYTWLLCWLKVPCIRCKRGNKVLYLGKIKRIHSHNDYHTLKQRMQLIDVSHLNRHFKSLNSETSTKSVRVICISDTHGRHSWFTHSIPDGDILVHCGDITFQGNGGTNALRTFNKWIKQFTHQYKIVIGGNHDRFMPSMEYLFLKENVFNDCVYLDNDSYVIKEFNDLSIFGCGWSPKGSDNNAFQDLTDDILNMNDTTVDILVGHSDMSNLRRYYRKRAHDAQVKAVMSAVEQCKACIHLCGHFHARYGVKIKSEFYDDNSDMMVVNCSSLDGRYTPTHCPVVFDVEL
eukprot:256807_1